MTNFHKLFLLVASVSLIACEQAKEVERPIGVPESAVWQGAEDGGDWVDCIKRRNVIECKIYGNEADNYFQQSYQLCGSSFLSNWFSVPDGEGLKSVPVLGGNVFFKPISPALFFRDGELDKGLSEKSKREFDVAEIIDCDVELVIKGLE